MTETQVLNHGWVPWYTTSQRRVYRRSDRVLTLWPNGDISCTSIWSHIQ